jgi:putative phosphoesterase
MRIAVIADIHGNLGALDAVLADIAGKRVDQIVNLGDVVSGPLQPAETADRLMRLGLPTVRGNHERQLLTLEPGKMGESDRFASDRLSPAQRSWLSALPSTMILAGDVYLCHGTPESDVDYFLESVDESGCHPAATAEVEKRAAGCMATLLLCGHTHLQRCLMLSGGRMVLNPGSVGLQAYEAKWPQPHTIEIGTPHARYAIAERVEEMWQLEFAEVAYDWESAARTAQANGRPEWAKALRTGRA